MNKEIFQFELWNECRENRCKFCSLVYTAPTDNIMDPERIHSPEIKNLILEKCIGHLDTLDWNKFDQLSFQGGEIMNEYDLSWLITYDELINKIQVLMAEGKINRLYLITSLKYSYDDSLLEFTLNRFKEKGLLDFLMVGTSYDLKYRFTKESEKNWWTNLGILKRQKVKIHCTTILSQFLIDAWMSNPIDKGLQRILKLFPNKGLDLIGTIGDRYSPQMPPDFLPKRNSFMRFCMFLMKNNYSLWKRFADQSGRRATHVYRPLYDDIIWRDLRHHTGNDPTILAPCGHFVYCHSYADSDGCYACDVEQLLDMEKGIME